MSSANYKRWKGTKGRIMFDDMNQDKSPYNSEKAYAQSKLAKVLHAKELARRLQDSGIVAFSLHPGTNESTNFVIVCYS